MVSEASGLAKDLTPEAWEAFRELRRHKENGICIAQTG